MVAIEEEYIRKDQIHRELKTEMENQAAEEEMKKEEERIPVQIDLIELKRVLDNLPFNLVCRDESSLEPKNKIIHEKRAPCVDSGQKSFVRKLAKYVYFHKIVWSENITAKHATRIDEIGHNG